MFPFWRLSETAKAVIWLWQREPENWVAGSHAVIHRQTGIAVWTANEQYGLSLYFNVPDRDRANAHPCNGRNVKLRWIDRRWLYRAVIEGINISNHREIQKQISDWGTDQIENHIGAKAAAFH